MLKVMHHAPSPACGRGLGERVEKRRHREFSSIKNNVYVSPPFPLPLPQAGEELLRANGPYLNNKPLQRGGWSGKKVFNNLCFETIQRTTAPPTRFDDF